MLWTSQGRYYTRNALLYSDMTKITITRINNHFAALFCIIYNIIYTTLKIIEALFIIYEVYNNNQISYVKIIFIYFILNIIAIYIIHGNKSLHEVTIYNI